MRGRGVRWLVARKKRRPPRKAAATKARKNKESSVKPPLHAEKAHGAAGGRCEGKRGPRRHKPVQIRFSGKGGKTCYLGLGSMTRTNFKDRRFRLEPSMQHFFSVVAVLSASGI